MENKKVITIIAVLLFVFVMIDMVFAQSVYKEGTVDFKVEANATPCYITIEYPNSTSVVDNGTMTDQTGYANYSFDTDEVVGQYNYYGECSGDSFSGVFEVTNSGVEFTQARSNFYIGAELVLMFFFIITLVIIKMLPSSNEKTPDGEILHVSQLKYFRLVMIAIAGGILLMMSFIAWNVGEAYMGGSLLTGIFETLYHLTFYGFIFGVILIFAYALWRAVKDFGIKKALERGMSLGDFSGK